MLTEFMNLNNVNQNTKMSHHVEMMEVLVWTTHPLSEVLREEHGLSTLVVVWKAIGADYKPETVLDHSYTWCKIVPHASVL